MPFDIGGLPVHLQAIFGRRQFLFRLSCAFCLGAGLPEFPADEDRGNGTDDLGPESEQERQHG
ncbi:hypothetical protein ACHMW4_19045 [Mesorhizobium sp. UC22_110]|uniref:hypothetical protein n=1 Tax=unclassified Mesorhizobium TaxID=325217 RepID=UPI0036708E3C